MTDYFAVLGEPRRPYLDAEALKQKFLTLSATFHPDRVHGAGNSELREAQDRYTELNAAYQCLREPKERLKHLIELERGARPDQVQRIPPDLMTLSLEVGQACREADVLVAEKARTRSPLLLVSVFERAQDKTEKLNVFQKRLETGRAALLASLRELDGEWNAESVTTEKRNAMLSRIEDLYRLLSYYERWNSQVRERIVQLSL